MKNLLILILGGFAFVPCLIAGEWSEATKITDITAGYKDQFLLFKTEKAHHNPKSCNSDYYVVSKDDADIEIIFAILLSAQRSGSEIRVGVDSSKCSTSAVGGRISVSRVRSL